MRLLFRWKRKSKQRAGSRPPEGVPVPEHVSDLWKIIQDIAVEEDSRFENRSVLEHSQQYGAEGAWDVNRWLEIYRQRADPEYEYSFPAHHPRHKGYCLVRRNWPTGPLWEAFREEGLTRLAVPPQQDKESLVRTIDEHLEAEARR